jgi:SAM-dependent methyltransferase
MKCRHCNAPLSLPLIDLGSSPPSNAYLSEDALHAPETWYPLRVLVCTRCWLVQTEEHAGLESLFAHDYAYFSSYSTTWLAHAERYVADMALRYGLGTASTVVEVAANDGYLLQFFKARGIFCTGIEPTASTAAAARAKGIPVVEEFFGARLAQALAAEGRQADLMVANNVLAHVPDINDFVSGFSILLKPHGLATFEFPHLMRLVAENQFDTIYHEHYSYLSLTTVLDIFAANGLVVFDVEELPTHGGSLRVFAQRSDTGQQPCSPRVEDLRRRETEAGMHGPDFYAGFQARADQVKNDFLAFLLKAKQESKRVVAYGAAAKGNTLLNYAGVRRDLIPFVVDRNPAKQGKYLPGSRIPIVSEDYLKMVRPEVVIVLPWNLSAELAGQLAYVDDWGGELVAAVPTFHRLQPAQAT